MLSHLSFESDYHTCILSRIIKQCILSQIIVSVIKQCLLSRVIKQCLLSRIIMLTRFKIGYCK